MPKIKCELHVYDLTKIGLYEGYSDEAAHLGGTRIFDEIKGWAYDSGRPVSETCTYVTNGHVHESYCLGAAELKGQYLFTLWNRVPNSKSGVGLINGSTAANKAKISIKKIGRDDIPGYPSYFWVLPRRKKIVAIRIENAHLGINHFRTYVRSFLEGFCSHAVYDDGAVVGYSDEPLSGDKKKSRAVNEKLRPFFHFGVHRIEADRERILERAGSITKLVKDIFVYNSLSRKSEQLLEKLRASFHGLDPKEKKKIRISMPVSVNDGDVKELFDEYDSHDGDDEYDVGFVFSGSSHIEWLSGAHYKQKATTDVEWIAPDQPDVEKLLQKLQGHIRKI